MMDMSIKNIPLKGETFKEVLVNGDICDDAI